MKVQSPVSILSFSHYRPTQFEAWPSRDGYPSKLRGLVKGKLLIYCQAQMSYIGLVQSHIPTCSYDAATITLAKGACYHNVATAAIPTRRGAN